MNVNAVNASPLKPQSFKSNDVGNDIKSLPVDFLDEDLDTFSQKADDVNSAIVQSNIKKPFAVIASVALAGLTAYKTGSAIVGKIASYPMFNKFVSTNGDAYFEKGIKKCVGFLDKKVGKFAEKGKFAKTLSSIYNRSEGIIKKGYQTVTKFGTKKLEKFPEQLGLKKLQNLGGVVSTAIILPSVCNNDSDKNGVVDIAQTDTNAYTGAKSKLDKGKNIVAKAIDLLT